MIIFSNFCEKFLRMVKIMQIHEQKFYDDKRDATILAINKANSSESLEEIRLSALGKTGEWALLSRGLKDVDSSFRPIVGKMITDARTEVEMALEDAKNRLENEALEARLASEKIDITIDKKSIGLGAIHPINQTTKRIADFFVSKGFLVASSPEIETDYYNFEALNTPSDHPARDTQDTLFVAKNLLLRSQTSAGQIRLMEKTKPPIRMIAPGKVYRADAVDATHSPMFHQMEGLVVDKGLTLCNLKGLLEELAKYIFGENTKTRFRPSYFPFTEPSVEVDASCFMCGGTGVDNTRDDGHTGCKVCKGTGWIEILGAGMVNRRVLECCNINPNIYTGFAFGMGIDRITCIMHRVSDLRYLFENEVSFLAQFKGGNFSI